MLRMEPIENPGTIGVVERYHAPVRADYNTILEYIVRTATEEECLRMAVFSVTSTVRSECLCPVSLEFGAMPQPPGNLPLRLRYNGK